MPKPSLRDRNRAAWAKTWAANKDRIMAYQKVYRERYYRRVVAPRLSGEAPPPMKAAVLFDGTARILEIACAVCDRAFIVRKARSNHKPKLCPMCQEVSQAMQKDEYEDRNREARRARMRKH